MVWAVIHLYCKSPELWDEKNSGVKIYGEKHKKYKNIASIDVWLWYRRGWLTDNMVYG